MSTIPVMAGSGSKSAPGAAGASGTARGTGGGFFEPLAPEGGAYAVKLPIFEGPLDLLLHLIRINEVDVTDIPISDIGRQYLEYLHLMRELNLEVAGEYLLMAATLAWIKSRMLLPPEPGEEGEEEGDPRAELVRRLLEYQRFKEVAEELDGRPRLGRDVFRAWTEDPEAPSEDEREVAVQVLDLVEALRQVMAEAQEAPGHHEVEVETVTVHERMVATMRVLDAAESLEFREIFLQEGGGLPTRMTIVTTFLALLELARLGALRIYQGIAEDGAPEGPIRVRAVEGAEQRDWQDLISELM